MALTLLGDGRGRGARISHVVVAQERARNEMEIVNGERASELGGSSRRRKQTHSSSLDALY